MKKIFNILALCGLVVASSSCNKYLDVNSVNPNSPTSSTPELVLPQAIVATAAMSVTFNTYGAWVGGFQANAGGYGGFGSVLTYNYSTTDNTGLWSGSYDNINDYQYIIDNSTPTGDYKYYNAAARIMKAFAYQRLVDQYGDIPYSEAVKGLGNLTPKYDKAEDIYKDLFAQLNAAIAVMNSAPIASTKSLTKSINGQVDVLFGYQGSTALPQATELASWVKFANTIKLRMLVRIQGVASLASTFSTEKAALQNNFISDDAIVQPGYVSGQSGKQNPYYNAYAYTYTGASANLTVEPTYFAVGFYTGGKLSDAGRAALVYKSTTSYTGQLGPSTNPASTGGSPWYLGNGFGILKGANAGQPIMLASESLFLQAEGRLIGLVAGDAQTAFDQGIIASFNYLEKDANNALGTGKTPGTVTGTGVAATYTGDIATYKTANTSYLVHYELATTDAQRLEAIITQKYIALNMITSDEAWNEYRRTGYPVTNPAGAAVNNMSSTQSISTRADKLPVRQKYPNSEYSLNAQNVPADKNVFTDRLFWDLN